MKSEYFFFRNVICSNQYQVKGIEEVIAQTKKNCSTATVNKDLDKKVKEKQQEVKERTAELNKAILAKKTN